LVTSVNVRIETERNYVGLKLWPLIRTRNRCLVHDRHTCRPAIPKAGSAPPSKRRGDAALVERLGIPRVL